MCSHTLVDTKSARVVNLGFGSHEDVWKIFEILSWSRSTKSSAEYLLHLAVTMTATTPLPPGRHLQHWFIYEKVILHPPDRKSKHIVAPAHK